jgi:hypothetical protein
MATITTDQQLETEVGTLAGAGLPAATATKITVDPATEELTTAGKMLPTVGATVVGQPSISGPTADQGTAINTTAPTAPAPNVGQVAQIDDVSSDLQQLGPAQAATFTPAGDYIDPASVQGTLSPGAMATAATQQLDQKATVQYQLGQLMGSLQSGGPMPAWASPQVRKVNAIMQQRGLGSSSMAAAAITTALMESGVQIATQDANKYAAIQLQNLNNEQQAALQNAATVAAMDTANLNARLKAEVTNAQAFLSIDLKNLDNEQKSSTLTYQSQVQGLFKDAAEENARQQFNAKNELQVEEFFAELGAQVETANANRQASMEQFNVSEANSMKQFNETLRDSRDKFNANMQFAVDQSNAVWRREVNTANTAIENEANRMNVQNEYNANQNALNNLWQFMRDEAAWNFQKGESELARQHDIGTLAMQFANSEELYTKQQKSDMAILIGKWLSNL